MDLPGCKFSQNSTETMFGAMIDNPQGYSVDSQKITIYADIPDTKEHDEDFFFK